MLNSGPSGAFGGENVEGVAEVNPCENEGMDGFLKVSNKSLACYRKDSI